MTKTTNIKKALKLVEGSIQYEQNIIAMLLTDDRDYPEENLRESVLKVEWYKRVREALER